MQVKKLLSDISKSYTPFHVVATAAQILDENGFERIKEENAWKLNKGGKYYVTKNDSAIEI